jgi:hypothetical protein
MVVVLIVAPDFMQDVYAYGLMVMDNVPEVELFACKGHHSDLDATVPELVDNSIQRYRLSNGLLPDANTIWFYFFFPKLSVFNHV